MKEYNVQVLLSSSSKPKPGGKNRSVLAWCANGIVDDANEAQEMVASVI